jgi:capsular exopolysaccharide synthesis family protein
VASNGNGNGYKKLSDALKRAAEEKDKSFQQPLQQPVQQPSQPPVITPPPAYEPSMAEKPVVPLSSQSSGVSKKIVAYHNPTSPLTEQFRVLRAHACSSDKGYNIKTMAITSSTNGEGKSVTAVNVAVVMAQDLGRPVLLIDCNMRKPAVASLLGLNGDKGLADILSGNAQLKDVLTGTDIANLTVLPAGHASANPNELLNSEKMKEILAELKPQFEIIVLDAPAVIPYADPRILGKLVDGVVIAVRAGKTRREVVARAESILKSVGVNILGYVLTGIEYHIPEYIHRHL